MAHRARTSRARARARDIRAVRKSVSNDGGKARRSGRRPARYTSLPPGVIRAPSFRTYTQKDERQGTILVSSPLFSGSFET